MPLKLSGVGPFEMTIHKGQRWSAASAYLRPALKERSDRLSIQDSVLVHKILFDGKKAIGVEFTNKSGKIQKIYANEVILSGGAINSPQLLMLSGKTRVALLYKKLRAFCTVWGTEFEKKTKICFYLKNPQFLCNHYKT